MVRKCWIGGNWKCNGTVASITELTSEFIKHPELADPATQDVVIFPSTVHIPLTKEKLAKNFQVGIQNISRTGNGAFTGETSIQMVADMGIKWVLVGHSERRQLYGETDEIAAEKVAIALAEPSINVAFCIGEQLSERESGKTMEVCCKQIEAVIPKVTDWKRVVIAYEPVWAIGTGKVATPQQAQEVHMELRKFLEKKVSKEVADNVRIVYGGSVTDSNCLEILLGADVDGFLVGGASLKKTFLTIMEAPKKL